jgi:hypothetical protein
VLERIIFSDLKLNKTVVKSKLYDINILFLVEDALTIYKKQTANGGSNYYGISLVVPACPKCILDQVRLNGISP